MSSPDFMSQGYTGSSTDDGKAPKDLLENRVDGLYICLISLHGLVRGDRMELGKDPDTGGQVFFFPILQKSPLVTSLACHKYLASSTS